MLSPADRTPSDAVLPTAFQGKPIYQVAMLVNDIRQAMGAWSTILGRDDWATYRYDSSNVPQMTYRGESGKYGMWVALIGSDPQLELIQPLAGPSIYHDWMSVHGEGLHHVGYRVSSIAELRDHVAADGLQPCQTGSGYGLTGDGGFAYYEIDAMPLVLEAIEVPSTRRAQDSIEEWSAQRSTA